ncbi:unnamed protein product [Trypanosoma congolense IL3000]|uniref:WGS project CAEQ00000000 data, annotated contig 698 n=1 Tax=Trypanosoma congolense (strain IL3000) TaxID=1068625 RepID=F9WHW3_TRYCI|nr:unnamed protein product [Trypanosoma congolense IL3000]
MLWGRCAATSSTWVSPFLCARRFVSFHHGQAPNGISKNHVGSKDIARNSSRVSDRRNKSEKTVSQSSKGEAAGATMRRSRFYRIASERGVGFAAYFYLLGESVTLSVLYALHSDVFGTGDTFSWLEAVGVGRFMDLGRWSVTGPKIGGLALSPRLLLNYLAANVFTYPVYRTQMWFCTVTFSLLRRGISYLKGLRPGVGRAAAERKVPKAPSVASKNKTNRLSC